MNNGEYIVKVAAASADMLDNLSARVQSTTKLCRQLMAENEGLRKQASAVKGAPTMNEVKLQKAASLLCQLYKDRAGVTLDNITAALRVGPDAMLDTIQKMASDIISGTQVSGGNLGRTQAPVQKKAGSFNSIAKSGETALSGPERAAAEVMGMN